MHPPRPPHGRVESAGRGVALRFLGAAGLVAVATAAGLGLRDRLSHADVGMVLLLAVLGAGAGFGLAPALLAAAAAALAYDFLFLAPRFTFGIARPADVLTFAVLFGAALATGWLAGRARDGEVRAAEREGETLSLLAATRRLGAAAGIDATARVLAEEIHTATGLACAVLLGPADGLRAVAGRPAEAPELEPVSRLAARWTLERREPSGAGTGVSPEAEWSLHPLLGSAGAEGVLAVRGSAGPAARLVKGLSDSGGLALERARLAEAAVEHETLQRAEGLRSAILNSLSHDLRTPLAGVLGSVTTLIDYGAGLTDAVRADLLLGVRDETERVSRYVDELLALSRLQAGALAPRVEVCDLRDVAAAALARVEVAVETRLPPDPALAPVDPVLLEQALVNVLDNARRHAGGAGVRLELADDGAAWRLSVRDAGPGMPAGLAERLFTPFSQGDAAARSGSGLGLSIARGFVEAMGGALELDAAPAGGGTCFLFRLPREAS